MKSLRVLGRFLNGDDDTVVYAIGQVLPTSATIFVPVNGSFTLTIPEYMLPWQLEEFFKQRAEMDARYEPTTLDSTYLSEAKQTYERVLMLQGKNSTAEWLD